MRFAVAASVFLMMTASALAQPGANQPNQPYYGPAPAPAPGPTTYPQQYAPQPYVAPQPAPQPPVYQPYAPQPQPPVYQPQYQGQPYQGQPYQGQPYQAPYAQAPVGGLAQVAPKPLKSASTGQLLAAGGTALGLLVIAGAAEDDNPELGLAGVALTLIAPSAGHIYANEYGHAVKMSLLRTGGLLTMIYGAVKMDESECYDYCYEEEEDNTGKAAMVVGGAVLVIGTIYDIYDSGSAVRRFNAKQSPQVNFGPTMMSSAGGTKSPGVALSGRF